MKKKIVIIVPIIIALVAFIFVYRYYTLFMEWMEKGYFMTLLMILKRI